MIHYGSEMLRINEEKGTIEYSTNGGRIWSSRYTGSSTGEIESLKDNGSELLATTSKGLYYSKNAGRTWSKRS